MTPLAIGAPGMTEILIIAGIIVVLFGARKLPEIGKGLGQGIKEFKTATKKAAEDDDAPPVAPPAAPPVAPPQDPTG